MSKQIETLMKRGLDAGASYGLPKEDRKKFVEELAKTKTIPSLPKKVKFNRVIQIGGYFRAARDHKDGLLTLDVGDNNGNKESVRFIPKAVSAKFVKPVTESRLKPVTISYNGRKLHGLSGEGDKVTPVLVKENGTSSCLVIGKQGPSCKVRAFLVAEGHRPIEKGAPTKKTLKIKKKK